MDFTLQIGASGLISRTVVQWLKSKLIMSSFEILFVSYFVNLVIVFVIEMVMAVSAGTPVSATLLKSIGATIWAAIYHDANTFLTSGQSAPANLDVPTHTAPVLDSVE